MNDLFKNKLILAPMAGITDLPFRILCREKGADMVYTEMVSAKGLMYNNKNSEPLLKTVPEEKPVGVQIFGSEPDIMANEAKKLAATGLYDFIDVNMGCPVPKIVSNHEGSALMKKPELIGEIVAALKEAVDIPVTIKIRAGFERDNKNAPVVAAIAEKNGVDAIAVHGRTREEYYQGTADWDIIKRVREVISIPLIGNGDIKDASDVIRMKAETGCDSVMVGRAAKGNPWIFEDIKEGLKAYEKSGEVLPAKKRSLDDIYEMILRHTRMMVDFKGEFTGIHEMRKHVAWYTTGLKNSSKIRCLINQVETIEELDKLMIELFKK